MGSVQSRFYGSQAAFLDFRDGFVGEFFNISKNKKGGEFWVYPGQSVTDGFLGFSAGKLTGGFHLGRYTRPLGKLLSGLGPEKSTHPATGSIRSPSANINRGVNRNAVHPGGKFAPEFKPLDPLQDGNHGFLGGV